MRKLTFLLMLVLTFASGLSMKAQEASGPADPPGFYVSPAPTTTADGVTVWSEDTKWYKLKMYSEGWRYVETGSNYTDASGKLNTNNTTATGLFTGAWAVVADNDGGYKFYNMGEGPSKVLGVTGSEGGARTSMVDATNPGNGVTTTFDITHHTDGYWYIKKHGTPNEYINKRDPYVGLWNSPAGLGNPGSCFAFEAIEDVSAYATAAQAKLLGRVGMWKKMTAFWAGATAAYDALNITLPETVTNAELVSVLTAQKTAGAAFVAAVNNQRFTASNRATNARAGAFMYMDNADSNKLKGRTTSTLTMDEVFTIKANSDFTFKIYNANVDKYVGTPGGSNTSAVTEVNAPAFDIYTESGYNDNVVVFRIKETASMHLLNTLNVSNYNDVTDRGSRWLLSTDVSRHELNTAIVNATTWKNNLETLVSNLVTAKKISVKPTSLTVTLPVALTKAQSAFDDAPGTPATRTAATTALNAALTKAQGAWLGEFGTTQQFRLKNHAITTETTENDVTTTTNFYLTMGQDKNSSNQEGNAILAEDDVNDVNQIFTLVPGTGNNAGKYILVSKGKQLTDLGDWNTNMTDAGTPYTFEEVDLANSLFRVRTTKGLLGPNAEVTGASESKIIYTNHTGTRDNLTWELEFVAPTFNGVDKQSLQDTYAAQNFVKNNSVNFVSQHAPSLTAYTAFRENAERVINGTTGKTVTQFDVNTAEAELKAAYQQMLANFVSEAGPTQGYLLQYYHPTNYTAKDLYLTFNTGEFTETHAVNALQLKQRSAATQQNAQFVSTGSNNSFYIREGFNKKLVGESSTYNWNPMLKDNGVAYTIELVTIDGIDGLVARLHNQRGYLGCDVKQGHSAVAANDYLYTNNSENNYFILTPTVSPDVVITLHNMIDRARRYEAHMGTGLGKYTNPAGMNGTALKDLNDLYTDMINETGSFEGQAKTTSGVTAIINDVYNTMVFPFTINKPTAGKLYRFKGKVSGKYMCATSTGQLSMVSDYDLPGTIFQLSEGAQIDGETGYKFLSYNTGYYNKETHSNGAFAADGNSFRIYESEDDSVTYYTLKSNHSGSKYVFDNGKQSTPVVDRNSIYVANNCDWTIEEVTWLPVPISQTAKFGTFCSPVPLAITDGQYYSEGTRIIFYTGAINGESGNLDLTRVTTNIPANTPVVTQYVAHEGYKNGCAYLKIAESADALGGSNDLRGTLETIATPDEQGSINIYTLQRPDGKPTGFYRHGGNTVKGFRAYLPIAPGAPAPAGFSFNFGTATGIDEVSVENRNDVIYDLSGRRVQKATNGLYIINGKKVLVK